MIRRTDTTGPRRWATIPNAVTILRLALVVPIAILIIEHSRPITTVALLLLFGASDWVDGFLARALDQASLAGAMLDPIADRVGVAVIVLAFTSAGHLHIWVVLLITSVDVALLATYAIMRPRQAPGVSWLGKIRTAVLMAGTALIGISLVPELQPVGELGRVLCVIGAPLHLVAGIGYIRTILGGVDKTGGQR